MAGPYLPTLGWFGAQCRKIWHIWSVWARAHITSPLDAFRCLFHSILSVSCCIDKPPRVPCWYCPKIVIIQNLAWLHVIYIFPIAESSSGRDASILVSGSFSQIEVNLGGESANLPIPSTTLGHPFGHPADFDFHPNQEGTRRAASDATSEPLWLGLLVPGVPSSS